MSEPVIQSYVFHESGAFFVSTIRRESSAGVAEGSAYNEVMCWSWNPKTRERGEMLYQAWGSLMSIHAHQDMCNQLFETGSYEGQEAA